MTMKKRNVAARLHQARGAAGAGRHKDKRRANRAAEKVALRKEVWL